MHETQSLYTGTCVLKYKDCICFVFNSLHRSLAYVLWHTFIRLVSRSHDFPMCQQPAPGAVGNLCTNQCFLQHCYPRSFQIAWLIVQSAKDVFRVRLNVWGNEVPCAWKPNCCSQSVFSSELTQVTCLKYRL